MGMLKKAVLADGAAVYAHSLFTGLSQDVIFSFWETWMGVAAYGFQIYFDFSGKQKQIIKTLFFWDSEKIAIWPPVGPNWPQKTRTGQTKISPTCLTHFQNKKSDFPGIFPIFLHPNTFFLEKSPQISSGQSKFPPPQYLFFSKKSQNFLRPAFGRVFPPHDYLFFSKKS